MAVSFLNSFLSYLVVLVVIAAVGAVAITLGITLRKQENKKEGMQQEKESADGEYGLWQNRQDRN